MLRNWNADVAEAKCFAPSSLRSSNPVAAAECRTSRTSSRLRQLQLTLLIARLPLRCASALAPLSCPCRCRLWPPRPPELHLLCSCVYHSDALRVDVLATGEREPPPEGGSAAGRCTTSTQHYYAYACPSLRLFDAQGERVSYSCSGYAVV